VRDARLPGQQHLDPRRLVGRLDEGEHRLDVGLRLIEISGEDDGHEHALLVLGQ
jgi:hypothetical protein